MHRAIQMAHTKLTREEVDAAVRVLRSGALRQGRVCAEFEEKFAQKTGAEHAVTCSSGTAALHLAYMASLNPGDGVLVPGFTFIATASMAGMVGAKPVFCDVDPETWLIDLDDAERKMGDETRAIAPVHLFGNACPVERIQSFANEHGLLIIWDAAQAHGTTYMGENIGAYGDLVCYSFYASKNMFTGEGGMVTTNNPQFAEKIRFLRTHGQTGKYYHTMLGLNYRMTDVVAAIGLKQLDRLDEMLAVRRRNGAFLASALGDVEGLSPQRVTIGSEHSYHQFCVLVDKDGFGIGRDELAGRLAEKGVPTGVHYPRGLNRQPVFIELYGFVDLPVTDSISEKILALPVHHGLDEEECRWVAASVKEAKLNR